ncbi:GNAT family N-acetyltransferase [Inquilinus sp. KBS0705]|nr:GNAT family N-acetyltransferase [Inquilinus sp. KBS0705]
MTDTLFESASLATRRFNTGDSAFIFELLNTPAWKKFIGDRGIHTMQDATDYIINSPLASYAKNGYGGWLVTLKDTMQPIGMCGLFKRDYLDGPDLGFAFLPEFEGRGYAYESTMAAIAHVRSNYNITGLYATTMLANARSRKLLERCGFMHKGTLAIPNVDDSSMLYYLSL